MKKGILIVSALVLSSIALAAPMFRFGKDEGANMMMKGETITISAYPKYKLLAKNIVSKSAILIYEGKVAHDPFEYYEKALQKDGWKLVSDAMTKPGDTMTKPGVTMDKPGDTMTKPGDTMAKGDDAMMKKSFEAKFSLKNYTITLTSKLTQANRVTVDFELK